ncbi:MAG: amino acid ABC transporter permease [Clostridiales bacterium]|nr:amino acid ABC transporter permease [Clostridiales bacterium]
MKMLLQMLEASAVTLELFALTLLFSLPLGLLVAFGRMSKRWYIQWPVRFYLLIMRGTPLILQLVFFYFGLNALFPINRFVAAVVAFALNYAAYFAEIYRGGIEAIPDGQREAAQVLGFTRAQTFGHILLPQVIKNILPAMGNEFMVLVKDTALAQAIGVMELFRLAFNITSREFTILPIFVAGLFYLIMNALVSKGFSIAEKKMGYYR